MRMLLFVTSVAFSLHAQSLQQGERDRAMSHMHATRKVFLDSIAGLTTAQWEFKPAPEVWSIAECAEHIVLSEDLIFDLATKKILASPVDPALKTDPATDQKVLDAMVDRSQKGKAPEILRPTNKWKTAQEIAAEFKKRRDRNIAYIQTTDAAMRAHASKHLLFGALDAYQWILLMSAHSQRHTDQLNEVKQSAGFPK